MDNRSKIKRVRKIHLTGEFVTLIVMIIVAVICGCIYGFDKDAVLPKWFEVFKHISWATALLFIFVENYEDGELAGYDRGYDDGYTKAEEITTLKYSITFNEKTDDVEVVKKKSTKGDAK